MPIRRLEKTYTGTTSTIGGDEIAASTIPVKPHIQPGVLQPAVAGKLLDGTTSHSGNYGTAQSDGHSYYYTDIKGSKPIKDPRIGAHFGSQRHKFTSLQLLEQETASHRSNVYSIDGRNWIRAYTTSSKNFVMENGSHGEVLLGTDNCAGVTLEIVGFFNNFNMISRTAANQCDDIGVTVNGGTERDSADTGKLFGDSTVASPLGSRYVSSGSVINHGDSNLTTDLGTTPKINTLKITAKTGSSEYIYTYGIELIAQDTTSTANKSKIQIPSQNVVSYGKKFSISGTPHYNPFAQNQAGTAVAIGNTTSHGSVATGWAGTGAGYYDDTLDTATSLGLSAWVQNGKYYRPVNGGRVVKWVDSSGNIKTSVNMMPPTGTSMGVSSATNTPEANSWTTEYQPLFSSTTIDHSLSEVAKTFHWREFGNGAANEGTGGTKADASMLNTTDGIAYVMDDGLTSLAGTVRTANIAAAGQTQSMWQFEDGEFLYFTFIGTGITAKVINWASGEPTGGYPVQIAQNLSYGSHIVKIHRNSGSMQITIDGIMVHNVGSGNDRYGYRGWEFIIHQPKMPPIPEDAVVLADYMLMADFVPVSGTANYNNISKGVRWQSSSRDVFADESDGDSMSLDHYVAAGYDGFHLAMSGTADSDTSVGVRLPFFGTNWVSLGYQHDTRFKLYEGAGLSSTDKDSASTKNNDTNEHSYAYLTSNLDLGTYVAGVNCVSGQTFSWYGFQIASPIHTSSHYQTFETPYLKDLVGGDRNMEQTNLVVTPDGKSWDEVTRDTSYLGPRVEMHCARDGGHVSAAYIWFGDYWRGLADGKDHYNKGIAIAYDRLIILEDGYYEVSYQNYHHGQDGVITILKNNTTGGVDNGRLMRNDSGDDTVHGMRRWHCKRGDYITARVDAGTGNVADGSNVGYNEFRIIKIG